MVKTLTVFLFFFPFGTLCSQMVTTIQGIVTDAETRMPLPFAQISVSGSSSGTVSNDDGLFILVVPDETNDSLIVSFLGYKTESILVQDCTTGIQEIALKPGIYHLREVEIIAFTPEEVLRRAFDSIPVNYGRGPVILTAFIRTRKTVNNKLAEYTEAIVENLKDGYYPYRSGQVSKKNQHSNIPCLFKGRVTSDTNLVNILGEVGAYARCLGCNFVTDVAEFPYGTILDAQIRKQYVLKMEEMVPPGNGKIFRIRFDQNDQTNKRLYQGEILIDSHDFAILMITYRPSYKAFDAYQKSKYNQTWFMNYQPGWIQEMPMGETTITYSKQDGFWTLHTIRQNYRITYVQPQNGQKIIYGYKNELVVTDVTRDAAHISEFKGDKLAGVNQRWDEVIGETDKTFWEHFNYLPLEENLKKELKEMGKLRIEN